MAQSDVTQEPQFKVLGADSVKFTITEVDDDAQQIHVSINCSELSTQPDDLLIDAWNLNPTEPIRLQIAKLANLALGFITLLCHMVPFVWTINYAMASMTI